MYLKANAFRSIFLIILASPSYELDITKERPEHFQGRHTRDIKDYEVIIPEKINEDGSFKSFSIPHFYDRDLNTEDQKRRHEASEDKVHYALHFDGKDHHIELSPNHNFMSPGLIIEKRNGNEYSDNSRLNRLTDAQCHYKGKVIGEDESRVALSACNGLSGYVKVSTGHFFIEPVLDSVPDEEGKHVHVIHLNSNEDQSVIGDANCGYSANSESPSPSEDQENVGSEYKESVETNKPVPKRLNRKHHYIESLIVADEKFIEYHKTTDVETYILTIMNIVSNYFHDESVGSLIDFTVVRIILLEKENDDFDVEITHNATSTLKSFCKWQKSINPSSHTHPNHHDVAILLTRQDLCSEEGNSTTSCSLIGMSNQGSACLHDKSCTINEDTGLVLGVTVTHELGHLLGCSNDPDVGCKTQAADKSYHIMSPIMKLHTSKWSNCSRKSIKEFLDSGSGDCLLDEPLDHKFQYPTLLPGAMYDATYQCIMQFGEDAKPCETDSESFCAALRCRIGTAKICWTKGDPAADGTLCGSDKWCFNEKCVNEGERPEAVDGDWGEWTPWTQCSRTCGGGVSMQERNCDKPKPKNRGRYCLGPRKQYRTCNRSPCNKTLSYRELQCAEFNNKTFNGIKHKWRVYKPRTNYDRCVLYCINENNKHKQLSPRVKDGTSCRPGRHDLCVGGECRQVGCDWELGSDAVEDECGVCKGDGTGCVVMKGTYPSRRRRENDRFVRSPTLKKVATIPKGVRNLKFEMSRPSQSSTIAISSLDGSKYYLNGTDDDDEGEFKVGGTLGVFSYPEVDRREVIIAGPTKESLVLYSMQSKNDHSKVRYSYAQSSTVCTHKPTYNWEFLEWEDCSAQCGGGSEVSEASCVEIIGGKVDNSYCKASERPRPKSRVCNAQPCLVYWKTGPWSSCEHSSFQFRNVTCMKETAHVSEEDIDESQEYCKQKRPDDKRACSKQKRPQRSSPLRASSRDQDLIKVVPRNVSVEQPLILNPQLSVKDAALCCEHRTPQKSMAVGLLFNNTETKAILTGKSVEEEPLPCGPDVKTADSVGEEVEIDESLANKTSCSNTEDEPISNKAEKTVCELLTNENTKSSKLKRPRPKVKTKDDNCEHKQMEDHIYPDEIELIGVPIAEKGRAGSCKPAQAFDLRLSDQANAKMGDRVPNIRLNFEGGKSYHGEAALEKLSEIEHKTYCRGSKKNH